MVESGGRGEGGVFDVVVFVEGTVTRYPMPRRGHLIIGRADNADISLDRTGMSRRHLRLDTGDALTATDLGSANGTLLRGDAMAANEPTPIAPGEPLGIGGVTLVVRAAGAHRARRLHDYDGMVMRVEEACQANRAPFALVRVSDIAGRRAASVGVVALALRADDVLADDDSDSVIALLHAMTPAATSEWTRNLEALLRAVELPGRCSVAQFPRHGRVPERLMGKVEEADSSAVASNAAVIQSEPMRALHELVRRAAKNPLPVLITGEPGVGKGLLAQELHRYSDHTDGPLVRVHCRASNAEALDRSLLGGEVPPAWEQARGGTLVLDGVDALPRDLQGALLNRLADPKAAEMARLVATGPDDMEAAVERGEMDTHLYYRLKGVDVRVPPLRQRRDEIESLARLFVWRRCETLERPPPSFTDAALALLQRYDWPGNVRELRNVIYRAVRLCPGNTLAPAHLPGRLLSSQILALPGGRGVTAAAMHTAGIADSKEDTPTGGLLDAWFKQETTRDD